MVDYVTCLGVQAEEKKEGGTQAGKKQKGAPANTRKTTAKTRSKVKPSGLPSPSEDTEMEPVR